MALELPFTIVILTLTGIASHNLYRTKLWQDGADNGFNSSPDEQLYAAANYRPYKVPTVWSELYVFLVALPFVLLLSLLQLSCSFSPKTREDCR